MDDRDGLLGIFIRDGEIDRAIALIRDAKRYSEGEAFVFAVFHNSKSTPELVEVVLEAFLNTKPNYAGSLHCGGGHHAWVHSLSHFTKKLWERRLDSWIKKFNEVSFKGANELGDSNCCDRLVEDFGEYSRFNDDPADFALMPENLRWMDWKYREYAKARIEVGHFESEEAFLRWKLHRPEIVFRGAPVDVDKIKSLIQNLQDLGADISEFYGLESRLLTKQLSELEAKLASETDDWERERLEEAVERTRTALESL